MSEPKWTPGPWIADDIFMQSDHRVRVSYYNGQHDYYHNCPTICECFLTEEGDDDKPPIGLVAAEANANLISAAPELYEALKACRHALAAARNEFLDMRREITEEAKSIIATADAALAKARGGTEG